MAKWFKALVLGISPKGRGFDPTAAIYFGFTSSLDKSAKVIIYVYTHYIMEIIGVETLLRKFTY